jgi:hypothetical protein
METFHPHTVAEARKRLAPRIQRLATDMNRGTRRGSRRNLAPFLPRKDFFPSNLEGQDLTHSAINELIIEEGASSKGSIEIVRAPQ